MRGTTESKWGQETDPQSRDLQALDRPDELYAAGDYPTLSEAGQGFPEWTAADRKIEQTDLVLWHTVGMQHVVRGEAGQDACALAQLRVAALRFLRWQPGVGLAKALTDSPENPVAATGEPSTARKSD